VSAKLYGVSLSHPSHAVRLMLERKGIDHEIAELLPGFHPLLVRAAGFRGGTVPALRIDGRRLQGSLRISRALDELRPDPPLFPSEPGLRGAVEEAEVWGEREFQPVPRRIFRWAVSRDPDLRLMLARDVARMPAPRLMAKLNTPVARYFARKSQADDSQVRADLANLPAMLDHVDALIAEGVIGGEQPNAADFQIGTTARVLLAFADLRPSLEGRPVGWLARATMPDYVAELPPLFPPAWLPANAPVSHPRVDD
jgi:glutathione S-transferase